MATLTAGFIITPGSPKKGAGILAGRPQRARFLPRLLPASYLSGAPAKALCWRSASAVPASALAVPPRAGRGSISPSQVFESRRHAGSAADFARVVPETSARARALADSISARWGAAPGAAAGTGSAYREA